VLVAVHAPGARMDESVRALRAVRPRGGVVRQTGDRTAGRWAAACRWYIGTPDLPVRRLRSGRARGRLRGPLRAGTVAPCGRVLPGRLRDAAGATGSTGTLDEGRVGEPTRPVRLRFVFAARAGAGRVGRDRG